MNSKRETRITLAKQPSRPARLPPEVQSYLGSQLRTAYGKLVREPIPDRLLDLVRRLEAKERVL